MTFEGGGESRSEKAGKRACFALLWKGQRTVAEWENNWFGKSVQGWG